MHGARSFSNTIETRERRLAQALFGSPIHSEGRLGDTALGQLPLAMPWGHRAIERMQMIGDAVLQARRKTLV